jgi:hypothetical protein
VLCFRINWVVDCVVLPPAADAAVDLINSVIDFNRKTNTGNRQREHPGDDDSNVAVYFVDDAP